MNFINLKFLKIKKNKQYCGEIRRRNEAKKIYALAKSAQNIVCFTYCVELNE